MLSQPLVSSLHFISSLYYSIIGFKEAFEMQHKQSKSVAVMCMSFQSNNVNNFAVGSEDGSVYTACRHGRYLILL